MPGSLDESSFFWWFRAWFCVGYGIKRLEEGQVQGSLFHVFWASERQILETLMPQALRQFAWLTSKATNILLHCLTSLVLGQLSDNQSSGCLWKFLRCFSPPCASGRTAQHSAKHQSKHLLAWKWADGDFAEATVALGLSGSWAVGILDCKLLASCPCTEQSISFFMKPKMRKRQNSFESHEKQHSMSPW